MKLKEKINKEIESNEGLSLLKSLWNNKRYRSLFWLILYFIFFAVIIGSLRNDYSNLEENQVPKEPDTNVSLNVNEILQNLEDYSYEILLNEEENLIVGEVKDDTNTFVYDNENYIIVGNNIYLEEELTLTKVDLLENSDLVIPIDKINIEEILEYIKDVEPVKSDDNIKYYLSMSNIFEDETINFVITFYGKESLETIELDFTDYVKYKELEYEEYVLTIKLDNKIKE